LRGVFDKELSFECMKDIFGIFSGREKAPGVAKEGRSVPRVEGRNPTILIVDDNHDNVFLLDSIITSNGYNTYTAYGGAEALAIIEEKRAELDCVILDLMMPDIDGLQVTKKVKRDKKTKHVPILLLTAKQRDRDEVAVGLDMGAEDYLTKPIEAEELLARVRSIIRAKRLQDEISRVNAHLEQLVEERTIEIMLTRDSAIFGLAKLAEYRDPETGGHLARIKNYVKVLSEELRRFPKFEEILTDEYIGNMYQSSPLHDIGKVGVPDHILLKPGKLTKDEFEIMKTHTSIGGDALASSERMFGDNSFLSMGRDIAYYHHEKWNGSGYPKGLAGDSIPLPARIMSIADIYDALTSKRVYKDAFPHEKTVSMITEESGKTLDPFIIKAFTNVQDVFQEIRANIDEIK